MLRYEQCRGSTKQTTGEISESDVAFTSNALKPEVAGITFSDSDSVPVLKFFNPDSKRFQK